MPFGTDPQDGSRRSWRLVRASKDAIPTSVRKFMRRARQRRLRRWRPGGLVALGVGIIGLFGWAIFASPVLGVRQVAVTGFLSGPGAGTAGLRRCRTALRWHRWMWTRSGPGWRRCRRWGRCRCRGGGRPPPDQPDRTDPGAAIPAGKQFDLLDDHGVIFRTVLSPPPGVIRMRLATPGPADLATLAGLTVLRARRRSCDPNWSSSWWTLRPGYGWSCARIVL